MSKLESWGRYPKVEQNISRFSWLSDSLPEGNETVIPYGLGRSYGDSCLNEGGTVILTDRLDRFISFNKDSGILRCEAGVTLDDIIQYALPQGWFLPVTPGTKYVTAGGAIANDVHGKNHHISGTFGCHIISFSLLRSDGSVTECSHESEPQLFSATIGGLGLTGLILTVTIQLKKVSGPYIEMESLKLKNIDEFFEVSGESDKDYEYTVAWLDVMAKGENFGRSIFMRGNHSEKPMPEKGGIVTKPKLTAPMDAPSFALNSLSVKAFNFLYYNKQRERQVNTTVHYDPFFYPLDAVDGWNKIYGKRGFLQFQCVVPQENNNQAIRKVLKIVVAAGKASFLSVMKEFGDVKSPGMLSFPEEGITLCLDFANQGDETYKLFSELEDIVSDAGGRLYPAKDARMKPESFKKFYPEWKAFADFIDPRFSSSFWRRVSS